MSCCTAMMSARGTMTSSTRRSRSARMLVSMVRSCGEKPPSPSAPPLQHGLQIGARRVSSSRTPRAARARARSRPARVRRGAGCGTSAGRLTRSSGAAALLESLRESLRLGASVSGMASIRPRSAVARGRVRVGHAEPRQDDALELLHRLGVAVRSRDRSPSGAEIHAPRDARDDGRTACLRSAASRAVVS